MSLQLLILFLKDVSLEYGLMLLDINFLINSFFSHNIFLMFQALDTFNTAVVSPIYYVMFTSLTILASVIMFKVLSSLSVASYAGCCFLQPIIF